MKAGKGYFVHLANILAKDSISRSSENFTFLAFLALSIHGLNLTRPTKYCSGLPQFLKTQICDVLKNGFPAYQHLPSSFFCRMTNRTNCQQHVTIPDTMTSEQFCFECKQKVKEKLSYINNNIEAW